MRKFVRQKGKDNGGANVSPNVELDFGAAAAKVAKTFPADEYKLRVQNAKVIEHNGNISVVLDLTEVDSGGRVDSRALWVDGPRVDVGDLAIENQHLIARLLTLAKLPTSGNVSELIPQLVGLEFDAHLVVAVDKRSGRSYNAIANIYLEDDAS